MVGTLERQAFIPTMVPKNDKMPEKGHFITSVRFRIAILFCGAYCVKDMMSVNIAMAMPCMVNSTYLLGNRSSNASLNAHCSLVYASEEESYRGTQRWSSTMQGLIFSAFDWGLLTMVITGCIVDKVNPKWMMLGGLGLGSVATVLFPVSIMHVGFAMVLVCRVLIGISDAIFMPSVNALIANWFPRNERNTAYGIATGGNQIGSLLILPISGLLCGLPYGSSLPGWPYIFYLCFGCTLILMISWIIYCSRSPSSHRWIDHKEVNWIESELRKESATSGNNERKAIPYRSIVTSPAVWATVIGVIGHEFPLIMLTIYIPSYLKDVLQYSVQHNGILSALPIICFWVSKVSAAVASDALQTRCNVSKSLLCKIFNSVACLGLGSFLLATTFLECQSRSLAVLFLCLSHVFAGFHIPGCLGTLVSIAPPYSGTITGLSYFLVAISGIVGPIMVGQIVKTASRTEWNITFYIFAAIAYLPLIPFTLWGTADVQSWARQNDPDEMNMVYSKGASYDATVPGSSKSDLH